VIGAVPGKEKLRPLVVVPLNTMGQAVCGTESILIKGAGDSLSQPPSGGVAVITKSCGVGVEPPWTTANVRRGGAAINWELVTVNVMS
jgi:hypothetical protein